MAADRKRFAVRSKRRRRLFASKSLAQEIYGSGEVEERYNCSYGLNPKFRDEFEKSGFAASGTDENGDVRVLELKSKQFYAATLFQPQLSSTPENPHKLILRYILEAKIFRDNRMR